MEKTEHKGFYMVVSVLIAIVLWLYVGVTVNPDDSRNIRNLPVNLAGLDVLESRGLMVTVGMDQTVTVGVTGKRDALNDLIADKTSRINISVDLSAIEAPGQYSRDVQVNFNLSGISNGSSVALTDRYPQSLTFTVVREAKRTIPVRGSLVGSVAQGYQAGEFAFTPGIVEVRGEESIVNQIEYALVTLNEKDMTATYDGELPYTFVGYTGGAVESEGLMTDVQLIRTTLPVFQLKQVPLTVNLISGGGATADNVEVKIEPETIVVSGAPADLEPLKSVSLGNIDLSKILGSDTLTFPINLSTELANVSGVTEATVGITIRNLTTATLEVDSIELIHIPEGYTAEAVTQTRQIQIRGTAEAVGSVTSSQLRIVADLDNAVAATGTQTIPVKVYLDGRSDVGVIGDYNIVISIGRD